MAAPLPNPPRHEIFDAIDNDDQPRVEALLTAQPRLWRDAPTTHDHADDVNPLSYAVRTGRRAIALWLIEHRSDANNIDQRNWVGNTALHSASARGDVLLMDALVRAGADPMAVVTQNGFTPLSLAARCNQTESITYLLTLPVVRANMDKPPLPHCYVSPLRYAVSNGQREAATLLIESGANPCCPLRWDLISSGSYMATLLHRAKTEPDRCRILRRLRALVDTSIVPINSGAAATGQATLGWVTARRSQGVAMPEVFVADDTRGRVSYEQERLKAVAAFAVGVGGEGKNEGLPSDLFMELLDMMTPPWDAARQGQPLGVNDRTPAWAAQGNAASEEENNGWSDSDVDLDSDEDYDSDEYDSDEED